MERRWIRIVLTAIVLCTLTMGAVTTARAEVLVPAMEIPETSAQTEEQTVGIPGAIVEESAHWADETEKAEETGSAVKTAGNRKKTSARASVQETAAETADAAAESTAASSGVIAARGVREAEAQAQAERDAMEQAGPGVTGKKESEDEGNQSPARGDSLGMFKTTGYCTCPECVEGSSGLTYSGTVPKAHHTVSADISLYPIGTRLIIGDVVYTVEDTGSNLTGNWIDIYYDRHEDAFAHGVQMQEVFRVQGEP